MADLTLAATTVVATTESEAEEEGCPNGCGADERCPECWVFGEDDFLITDPDAEQDGPSLLSHERRCSGGGRTCPRDCLCGCGDCPECSCCCRCCCRCECEEDIDWSSEQ